MEIDNKSDEVSIPVPPAPPVPVAAPAPAPIASEAPAAPPAVDVRASLLEGIQSGVALRHVTPEEKTVANPEEPKLGFASELHWKIRETKNKMRKEGLTEEETKVMMEVRALLEEPQKITTKAFLKHVVQQIAAFEKMVEPKTREVLAAEVAWPKDAIVAMEEILNLLNTIDGLMMDSVTIKYEKEKAESKRDVAAAKKPAGAKKTIWYQALLDEIKALTRWMDNVNSRRTTELKAFLPNIALSAQQIPGVRELASRQFNMLFAVAMEMWEEVSLRNLSKFDLSSRAHKCYQLLQECTEVRHKLRVADLLEENDPEIAQKIEHVQKLLMEGFHDEIAVRGKIGQWSKQETVTLRKTSSSDVAPQKVTSPTALSGAGVKNSPFLRNSTVSNSSSNLGQIKDAIKANSIDAFQNLASQPENKDTIVKNHLMLARQAIEQQSWDSLKIMAEVVGPQNYFDWVQEAVSLLSNNANQSAQGSLEGLFAVLPDLDINHRLSRGGNTALHVAARNNDLKLMHLLISRFGADPLLLNGIKKTALQMIATTGATLAPTAPSATSNAMDLSGFAKYLDNPKLSDVTLVAEDGSSIHAHRVILSAQCEVFRAMLDGEGKWEDGLDNDVQVNGVSGKVLRTLVEYLYTGSLNFVADDPQLTVELLAVASRFMLSKMQYAIEASACPRVNSHNAFGMHRAAVTFEAKYLKDACKGFILENYEKLSEQDTSREELLFVLESSSAKS